MKSIKIIIKCAGLSVRTNDLAMGLGILDQIEKYGIMKHTFMPDFLIEKASTLIEYFSNKSTIDASKKLLTDKFSKSFSDTAATIVPVTRKLNKKRKGDYSASHAAWTQEEDMLVCNNIDTKSSILKKNKTLRSRHTAAGIASRLCAIRSGGTGRMGRENVKFIKKYLASKGTNSAISSYTPVPKKSTVKYNKWKKDEINAIETNMNLSPKELMEMPLLKDRSAVQIYQKKDHIKRIIAKKEVMNEQQS